MTIAEHGHEPTNGERVMAGFMKVFPEGGPSVSQNTETGTLTILFSLDAEDAREAVGRALDIFGSAMAETDLEPTAVLDVEASVETAERELQPA